MVAPRLDSLQHGAGLAKGSVERDTLVEGTMNSNQITTPNKLLEFEEMDVARCFRLGGVQDHKQMVGVRVGLRDVTLFTAVLYGERMKTKHFRQHPAGLFVTLGEVYPYEPVLACKQGFQVLNLMPLDPRGENPMYVHPSASPEALRIIDDWYLIAVQP
jgi:hypothetical protein